MPFTPFHFGLGLGLGLPLRRHIHAPTFILANAIIDVEPFLVLILELRYPLHGYLHTFLLAIPMGFAFGYVMLLLEKLLRQFYKALLLEEANGLKMKSFIITGGLGTGLHVLLDAPLYPDIKPLYPIKLNPLYNPDLIFEIYALCTLVGSLGALYYIALLGITMYRKLKTHSI